MSEEKEPKEEEIKDQKDEEVQEEVEETESKPDKAPRLKITKMTMEQVEKRLDNAMKTMGGYNSDYARALLARKEVLLKESPQDLRKAA